MAKLGREARKRRGRAPKVAAVAEVTEALKKGQGYILVNNKGLTLSQATALRKKLRESNVALKVVKNTLLRIALKEAGYDADAVSHLLTNETMIAVGYDNPVTPAKLLMEYAKDNDKLQVKGGYFEGKALDSAGVESLSKMPGREELLQRFLGSLNAPAQNFVYALNATVSKPVYLLDAVRRQKEEAEGGAAA